MPARRHRWDHAHERRIPACDAPDGNDRTEKDCTLCGIVKITVHGADRTHWHKWRLSDGQEWPVDSTPACEGTPKPAPTLAAETASEVMFR